MRSHRPSTTATSRASSRSALGALHDEDAAGGVDVVGDDVDERGRLAVEREAVGHRDRRLRRLVGRLDVDPDATPVEGRVAVAQVVVEEVGARLVGDEADRAVDQVGADLGPAHLGDLAGELRPPRSASTGSEPGRSLASGRIVTVWPASPATTSGSATPG